MCAARTKPDPERPILYAKAGVTPGWRDLEVVRAANGRLVGDVVEANAHEGWVIQRVRVAGQLVRNARGDAWQERKVWAAIKIRRREKP